MTMLCHFQMLRYMVDLEITSREIRPKYKEFDCFIFSFGHIESNAFLQDSTEPLVGQKREYHCVRHETLDWLRQKNLRVHFFPMFNDI